MALYSLTWPLKRPYNSPFETTSMFHVSGMILEDLGRVRGTFLEDLWGGVWDIVGTFVGGMLRGA